MAGALPLGIAVAYGRRSQLPVLRGILTGYVELARGIPLVAALFVASFLLPLFFPDGMALDMLWRVLIAIVLFAAAYLSEIIRAGCRRFRPASWTPRRPSASRPGRPSGMWCCPRCWGPSRRRWPTVRSPCSRTPPWSPS
jgi:His/Glu/Gln/Arg/opine family amino acid ABC transporter permease subunit